MASRKKACSNRRRGAPKAPGYVVEPVATPSTKDYVVCELKRTSQVGYSSAGFDGSQPAREEAARLNKILDSCGVKSVASHFDSTKREVSDRVVAAPSSMRTAVTAEFEHSGFVQLEPRNSRDIESMSLRLNRSDAVWQALLHLSRCPPRLPPEVNAAAATSSPARVI